MSNNKHRGFPVHEYLSTDRSLLMHGCTNIKRQLPLPLIKIYNICLTVFFISSNLYPLKISLPSSLFYIFLLSSLYPPSFLFLFFFFFFVLKPFKLHGSERDKKEGEDAMDREWCGEVGHVQEEEDGADEEGEWTEHPLESCGYGDEPSQWTCGCYNLMARDIRL